METVILLKWWLSEKSKNKSFSYFVMFLCLDWILLSYCSKYLNLHGINSQVGKYPCISNLVKSLTHTCSNPNYGFLIKAMHLLLISVMGCSKEQKRRLKFKIFQMASFFYTGAEKEWIWSQNTSNKYPLIYLKNKTFFLANMFSSFSFDVLYPFGPWAIKVLHNFLPFVALSNFQHINTPLYSCFIIPSHKLIRQVPWHSPCFSCSWICPLNIRFSSSISTLCLP